MAYLLFRFLSAAVPSLMELPADTGQAPFCTQNCFAGLSPVTQDFPKATMACCQVE